MVSRVATYPIQPSSSSEEGCCTNCAACWTRNSSRTVLIQMEWSLLSLQSFPSSFIIASLSTTVLFTCSYARVQVQPVGSQSDDLFSFSVLTPFLRTVMRLLLLIHHTALALCIVKLFGFVANIWDCVLLCFITKGGEWTSRKCASSHLFFNPSSSPVVVVQNSHNKDETEWSDPHPYKRHHHSHSKKHPRRHHRARHKRSDSTSLW